MLRLESGKLLPKLVSDLQDAYRILQNPNATEIQVARAQRVVGNPFFNSRILRGPGIHPYI